MYYFNDNPVSKRGKLAEVRLFSAYFDAFGGARN